MNEEFDMVHKKNLQKKPQCSNNFPVTDDYA